MSWIWTIAALAASLNFILFMWIIVYSGVDDRQTFDGVKLIKICARILLIIDVIVAGLIVYSLFI